MTNTEQYSSVITTNTSNNNSALPMDIGERTTNSSSHKKTFSENTISTLPLLNDDQMREIYCTQTTQNNLEYSSNQQIMAPNLVANNNELQDLSNRYELIEEENKKLLEKLNESEDTVKAYENAFNGLEKDETLKNKNEDLLETNKKLVKQNFEQTLKLKELLPYRSRVEESLRIVDELRQENNELKDEKNSLGRKYSRLKQNFNDQKNTLQQLKQNNENRCNELDQKLKDLRSQIRTLRQKNTELEDEASSYQSALGVATNFKLSDDDQNHTAQFNDDILALHDTLENYVTNLKPKIDVNVDEAKKLLIEYGSQAKISSKDPNKPLIKAVLQRHVLREILKYVVDYFKRNNKEYYLESDIVAKSNKLIELMGRFCNTRVGDDEVTRVTPIKLRQQVYTALGSRGFSNIKKSDGDSVHDYINYVSKKINEMINIYRVIKDIEKKKYVDALAEDLIRNVFRIFYFRSNIQEPKAQFHWFNYNDKIDKSLMKGSWGEDEDDLVVEVCSFPLIYSDTNGLKIYTPAKVFPVQFVKQSFTEKLQNVGQKIKKSIYNGAKSTENDSSDQDEQSNDKTDKSATSIYSDESDYYSPTEDKGNYCDPIMTGEDHNQDRDSIQENEYQTSNATITQENVNM
ncbi:6281_t:CDS:1 [Funneliformis geosporum]|uniref:11028_t:CDS:1 n=1 Tax=Funneliformis geosporum TaxID=1117311 RepID=A0A9W4SM72_9GLOM|nr:11028_t:CDS:1 [Funneliformis geosporum]CAI2174831.1 6281_t:CDS:1 [Funneliformis geosporum]